MDPIDPTKVFLLGWALGGGMVVDACRELDPINGIIAVNGLFDGLSFQQWHRSDDDMVSLRVQIEQDRLDRVRTGRSRMVDPFEIYPLDPQTLTYVRNHLDQVDGYDSTSCSFEFAESLLRWSVLPWARRLDVPLYVIHGQRNALHPPNQVKNLVDSYRGPVDMLWLPNAGHTEWMTDNDSTFVFMADQLVDWIDSRLMADDR